VDTSWGDKAGLDRPRRPIRPGRRAWNRRLLQPPVRQETASALRVRYKPVNSTTGLFGNDLETISAHWPMVMGHIHHFLPRTA